MVAPMCGRESAVSFLGPFGCGGLVPASKVRVGVAALHSAVLAEDDAKLLLGECSHLGGVEFGDRAVFAVDLAVSLAHVSADIGLVFVALGEVPAREGCPCR